MPFKSGAVIDTRPQAKKEKDFHSKEVVASANPVNWVEKAPNQWRKFPIFNQNGSGSCVAQTQAKEFGIMRWLKDGQYIHFSATDIYQRRSNRPQSGMGAVDARSIASKGATLEVLAPSQVMTDQDMDNIVVEPYKREIGAVFAVPNYLALPTKDIDAVASFIQTTGKGAMVWFYFNNDNEWTERPTVKDPNLDLYLPTTNRHSVTAVDFCLVNGKKCLIIEDSWGPGAGMGGQRIIDEDFYNARNWYASYLVNFRFDENQSPVNPKPIHTFTKNLEFKPLEQYSTDVDVVALQDILKYEGLFPVNTSSTGYYGALTAKSVLAWQKKHAIAPTLELESLGGKVVGPKTRIKLNELYSQ